MKDEYFTVTATGNTYPVREHLQSWAFHWEQALKAWVSELESAEVINVFMHQVAKGEWPGVILALKKEKDYSSL